jgi:uncharacterized membrane protein
MKKIIGYIILDDSVALTVIYTFGHIIIAALCNYFITGARWDLATFDAIVEPCINGAWFYALHKIYKKYKSKG